MPIVQVVQVPQVQLTKKIVESSEIQSADDTQTSESLGAAPSRRVTFAATVERVEVGSPLPPEPVSPMHVTTPVVEVPPVVVEYVQPESVVDVSAPAPTVTYTAQSPLPAVPAPPLRDTAPVVDAPSVVVEHVPSAPVVELVVPAPTGTCSRGRVCRTSACRVLNSAGCC